MIQFSSMADLASKILQPDHLFGEPRAEGRAGHAIERFASAPEPLSLSQNGYWTEFSVSSVEDKAATLERVQRECSRHEGMARKDRFVLPIAEEIMLNMVFSAPHVARELGTARLSLTDRLALDFNDDELWLHGIDGYGVFLRKNLSRSFFPTNQQTHGHSGRGMALIFTLATDILIRSELNFGTWVAARLDLKLTNREHEREPKRIFLDMK